ncbi:MAG: hypothetical protein ACREPM_20665 [Gemmatimonadaceae bacterium]
MRHFLIALCLAIVAGCSGSTAPDAAPAPSQTADFARSLGDGGPVTFVLGRVENQSSDPIVTFDHTCQGVLYQSEVRDTVMLWPDGRARRAFTIEDLTNGAIRSSSHLAFSGTWSEFKEPKWYYFSDGPSITLTVSPDSGQRGAGYSMNLRVSTGSLSAPYGLGGSCPGSPNDGHEAIFAWTRR